MKITENCIINGMPAALYHSDPTPILEGFAQSASFSSSMANAMIGQTEEEAMLSNQRLNQNYKEEKSDSMDFGTVAHDYVLRSGRNVFEIAPFDNFMSNAAKVAKSDIQSRGLIALNQTTAPRILDNVKIMKDRLHEQLAAHRDYPGLMMKGKGEQAAFAFDGEIWNRAMIDWLDDNYPDLIVDYKTTALDFDRWEKNELWDGGKYIQSPHYRKTYDLVSGQKSKFIFVVQQTKEPFHVRVYELDRSYDEDIDNRYFTSRKRFVNCLKTGLWRGQPPYTTHSCPPPWVLTQWEIDAGDMRG